MIPLPVSRKFIAKTGFVVSKAMTVLCNKRMYFEAKSLENLNRKVKFFNQSIRTRFFSAGEL